MFVTNVDVPQIEVSPTLWHGGEILKIPPLKGNQLTYLYGINRG
jgi:hypothetical protein